MLWSSPGGLTPEFNVFCLFYLKFLFVCKNRSIFSKKSVFTLLLLRRDKPSFARQFCSFFVPAVVFLFRFCWLRAPLALELDPYVRVKALESTAGCCELLVVRSEVLKIEKIIPINLITDVENDASGSTNPKITRSHQ